MQMIQFEKTIDAEGRVTVTYEKGVSIFTTLLKRTTPPMPPGVLTATLVPNETSRSALIAHLVVAAYCIAEHLKMPVWQLLADVEKHIKEQDPITLGVTSG